MISDISFLQLFISVINLKIYMCIVSGNDEEIELKIIKFLLRLNSNNDNDGKNSEAQFFTSICLVLMPFVSIPILFILKRKNVWQNAVVFHNAFSWSDKKNI